MALGRFSRCFPKLQHNMPSKGLFLGSLQSDCMASSIGAKRHLLSEDIVKLQDFQQRKLAVAHLASGSRGNYFDIFADKLKTNQLILGSELKMLIHLCQSADEVVTVRDAIYRYHQENRNTAFGSFRFGPLFMRLCYEQGMEEVAAAALLDKNMRGFFNDSTSFNIAIDMLFTKGCYESAFEVLRNMRNQGVAFNKATITLAYATCYKLNTPESYRVCTTLIEVQQKDGYFIPKQAHNFAVALALRQNDIKGAQFLYSQMKYTDSAICQNLRVVILAMTGAMKDATSVLKAAMWPKTALVKRTLFAQEVVALLRLQSEDTLHLARVEEAVSRLQQAGQVTQQSLDDMLCFTPTGDRRKQPPLGEEERRVSRRTLRPIPSTLMVE